MISDKPINFELVIPSESQIHRLYKLLGARRYNISHRNMPTFEEHSAFVQSHPYRSWYILNLGEKAVGSIYITEDNSIGLNIEDDKIEICVPEVIKFIKDRFDPNPGVKSLRCERFCVNVSPDNKNLIRALEGCGATVVQISFALK